MAERTSVVVEQLKAAGTEVSKQVPPLLKLGEWYLNTAKTTANGADFTKAAGLFNAALMTQDEIRNEISSHKEWIADERRVIKERVDEIDSWFKTNDKTEEQYEIKADKMHEVFQDIQDMFVRLVSMLAKECESRIGQPPCGYAIIALGSVARVEATPFLDLEFVILYSDPTIGDKISYFRVLTHFLHLKVVNLGETILPSLGIEELNDFQSSNPNGIWFHDSETPRGISFDGAMPWASKTPLGRMATKNKPALELIRTPEQMAEFQDEEFALKEGYHLADIVSRTSLFCGMQVLLDEYNDRVTEKLTTKSRVVKGKTNPTIGCMRGIRQMRDDNDTYAPFGSHLGASLDTGGIFDAKKEFYRLISLLLSDLGLIFDIRSPSPWQVISELVSQKIIDESENARFKVCLSIANEIRLKTCIGNNGQKEVFSPVPLSNTEQSIDDTTFVDFDEDTVVRLLSSSTDISKRCLYFTLKYFRLYEIDTSIFRKHAFPPLNAFVKGVLYYRLQNFPKALEWLELIPKDSPKYSDCLDFQGIIYG
ncbi:tetratricopeptide repeat 28-like, partial [Paramuricea clavata]